MRALITRVIKPGDGQVSLILFLLMKMDENNEVFLGPKEQESTVHGGSVGTRWWSGGGGEEGAWWADG